MLNDIDANNISLQTLLNAIRTLSSDERRQLWRALDTEFGVWEEPSLREMHAEYRIGNEVQMQAHDVKISFHLPSYLALQLQAVAQERSASVDAFLNELLATSLAILQMGNFAEDDTNSLAIRRELAAASVAALGDFWDNEVDREWQDFQP